jgi:hypothetical protein
MSNKNISIDVNVLDFDKVKTLIELLHKHRYSIPEDLVESLLDLSDCDHCEIGVGNVSSPSQCHVMIDGKAAKGVVSVNKILRRVTLIDKSGEMYFSYPKSASIISADNKILVSF